MRQAADILSSAPAMQIRQLEAMQQMAKTANSKVIFLPTSNPGLQQQLQTSLDNGEGPSNLGRSSDFGDGMDPGFHRALNAHIVSEM
jgi:hypothetical protein